MFRVWHFPPTAVSDSHSLCQRRTGLCVLLLSRRACHAAQFPPWQTGAGFCWLRAPLALWLLLAAVQPGGCQHQRKARTSLAPPVQSSTACHTHHCSSPPARRRPAALWPQVQGCFCAVSWLLLSAVWTEFCENLFSILNTSGAKCCSLWCLVRLKRQVEGR